MAAKSLGYVVFLKYRLLCYIHQISIHGSKIPDDGVRTSTHVEVNTDNLFYTCYVVQVLAFEMKVYRY